ncbi:MAG TPA: hypothetical protein VFN10_17200 [Thermoanaerobaculia bacterium]|nr:hypothetical protein [Thermoanaerobaculia bacterium]
MTARECAWATLKSFGWSAVLLGTSVVFFAATMGLNGLRAVEKNDGAISARGLVTVLSGDHSDWSAPLSYAVLRASHEVKTTHFEASDPLYRAVVRVLRAKQKSWTSADVTAWINGPSDRNALMEKFHDDVAELDRRGEALLAKPSAKNRERFADYVLKRQMVEAKYRRDLVQQEARVAVLDPQIRDTFNRAVLRLDGFSRAARTHTSLFDRLSSSFVDEATPLFPAYEIFWYACLTIAVLALAGFLFRTVVRILPVNAEPQLQERIQEIVKRPPPSSFGANAGRAAIGLAALGLSAAATIPPATAVAEDPWHMPVTAFSMFSPATAPSVAQRGTDGAAGATGATGATGNVQVELDLSHLPEFSHPVTITNAKVDVSAPEEWTQRIVGQMDEKFKREHDAVAERFQDVDERVDDVKSSVGDAAGSIVHLDQRQDSQQWKMVDLVRTANGLRAESAEYEAADQDAIEQERIWDSRPWWRAFRSLYQAGPVSKRVLSAEFSDRPVIAEAIKTMPEKMMTSGDFRKELLDRIGNQASLEKNDYRFILKICRVER